MKSLKKGIFWSLVESSGSRILQFVGTLLLARLLFPEDFGLVASAQSITGLVGLAITAGWRQVLLRNKHEEDILYQSVFTFQLLVGVFSYIAIFIMSPTISRFLSEDKLIEILPVLSVAIFGRVLTTVPIAILQRDMNFKIIMKINLLNTLLSLILGVSLAIFGFGVWSLIYGVIFSSLFGPIFLCYFSNFKPKLSFSIACIKGSVGESYRFAVLLILDHLVVWGPYAFVSKWHGAESVGLLQRGISTAQIPFEVASGAINAPMFRAYSAADNRKSDDYYFLRAIGLWTIYLWPIGLLFGLYPDKVISLMYGEQWLDSEKFLSIFSFYMFFMPLYSVSRVYVSSVFGPNLMVIIRAITLIAAFVSILFLRVDIYNLVLGLVLALSAEALVSFFVALARLNMGLKDVALSLKPAATGIISTFLVHTYIVDYFYREVSWMWGIFIILSSYILTLFLFPYKNKELLSIRRVLLSRLRIIFKLE